jgi:hypothetical protein
LSIWNRLCLAVFGHFFFITHIEFRADQNDGSVRAVMTNFPVPLLTHLVKTGSLPFKLKGLLLLGRFQTMPDSREKSKWGKHPSVGMKVGVTGRNPLDQPKEWNYL